MKRFSKIDKVGLGEALHTRTMAPEPLSMEVMVSEMNVSPPEIALLKGSYECMMQGFFAIFL